MPLLTSPEDRADLMWKYYGIQDVIVEPFTPQRMKQPWREFLEETLVGDLGAVHLVAGSRLPLRLQRGGQSPAAPADLPGPGHRL